MTNRVALVTGANRGLGRGIAEGLARLGCIVAVGEREEHSALETLATIGLAGLTAHSISIDVTDENSVKEAVARVLERNGRLDIVINNAGGHYDDSVRLSGISDSDMLNALDLNLLGAMRVCRAAVPVMRSVGWGRIVNVSSRSGTFAATWANAPAYGVSKAALNMYTLQLAQELEGTGVLVNSCCPGWVRTDMGGAHADKSIEEGADTPIWLASLPDDGPTGLMFGERTTLPW